MTVYFRVMACFVVDIINDDGTLADFCFKEQIFKPVPEVRGPISTYTFAIEDSLRIRRFLDSVGEEQSELVSSAAGEMLRDATYSARGGGKLNIRKSRG